MKKYRVRVYFTGYSVRNVEAENWQEAEKQFYQEFQASFTDDVEVDKIEHISMESIDG